MPQPVQATEDVFAKANKVVKVELLPIPNIPADFMFNHNTEVLLTMLRDIWEHLGPAIKSGLVPTYDSGLSQWTVTAGRILHDGYDITIAAPLVSALDVEAQRFIIRVVERQLTFESDPGVIGFIPPGFSNTVAGANQYRWVATLLRQLDSDPAYVLQTGETKFIEIEIADIDVDGVTILSQLESIGGSIADILPQLIEDVSSAISIRTEQSLRDVTSAAISTAFTTAVPVFTIWDDGLLKPWDAGWGAENWGLHPLGSSYYLPSGPQIEDAIQAGAAGLALDLFVNPFDGVTQRVIDVVPLLNDKGMGQEGDFGNTEFGAPGATPAGAGIAGWGADDYGIAGLGIPAPATPYTDLYVGRRPNDRFDIKIKNTGTGPTDNSSFFVDAKGVKLPAMTLVGEV